MLVSQAFTKSLQVSKQRASNELSNEMRHLQFCEVVLNDERQGNCIVHKITWSNEAHIKLSGVVNQHNCVYYSTKNPHVMIEEQLNQPGITLCVGLLCKGTFGHIFFHTTVTHDLYLNMLRDTVLPQLQRQHDNDNFFFQQSGAPPHYAVTVRRFLDEQLTNRWIG